VDRRPPADVLLLRPGRAVLVIEHGDDAVAAHIASAGEVLDALAKTSAAHTRTQLRDAAVAFERASRSLGRGEDGATTAMAIDMLFFLITATAHWHAKKGHAQQAAAARQTAEHLRTAYQLAAARPLGALYQHGRNLGRPLLQRQTTVLRQALPDMAEQILAEPDWYALAATLTDATGHDPASLLADAAGRRELGTAESVSDVLVWRLRRAAGLPVNASATPNLRDTPAFHARQRTHAARHARPTGGEPKRHGP